MPHGFIAKRDLFISEIQCHFIEWEHETSGAKFIHLKNDDPENVFCLSLSTLPKDSTGVAHILEHMVLCGSKHFPVKDPFFSMIRRSLNTFMNAFTGSDFTCYPAASQNETDFYNLLNVYLDAVFYPNLDERSFKQEGHRLEWKDRENKRDLQRGGIVFNEMKGVYIQPDTHLWRKLHEALLDETLYSFDSGGDPCYIPDLTHEALINFHKEYYDPSRCLFFFYGNLSTEKHAAFLEEKILKNRQKLPSLPPRKLQTPHKAPISLEGSFPATSNDEEDNKPMAALSWLGPKISQTQELLMIELLDSLLMGHDGAYLKKSLLEASLSSSLHSSFDQEMLQSTYTLIFKDMNKTSLSELFSFVDKRLKEIHQEGFDKETIESAIHQLKLSRLEITGGGYPFGLLLYFRCGLLLQQGGDGLGALKLQEHLEDLESLIENPKPLLDLMKRLLIDNTHRVDLWMKPDLRLNEEQEEREKAALQKIEKSLTSIQKEEISKAQITLEEAQNHVEDKNILPIIHIHDIHRTSQHFPLKHDKSLYFYETFTNGFIYHDAQIILSADLAESFTPTQWQDLKILGYLWPRLGSGNKSYDEQLESIDRVSAGLGAGLHLVQSLVETGKNEKTALASFAFSIHGLQEKSHVFLNLLEESILKGRLDEKERILQLMRQLSSSLQNQIPANALQYALNAGAQPFSQVAALNNLLNGVPFLRYVRSLDKRLETDYEGWIHELISLRSKILDPSQTMIQTATLESAHVKEWQKASHKLQSHFKETSSTPYFKLPSFEKESSSAYSLNAQVSFNTLTLEGPDLMASESMALRVACEMIKQQILHPEIREKGGAYGYGCAYHPDKKVISFHSYRDPHISRTLEVFQSSVKWILEKGFDQEMMDEAKRCLIQKLDKPLTPGEKASLSLLWDWQNMSLEKRQFLRARLLDVTFEEVIESAKKWLSPIKEKGIICLFGPEKGIQSQTSLPVQQP